MKNKNIIKAIFISSVIFLTIFSSLHPVFSASYTNQEKIPGATQEQSEFIPYLKDIINFGFAIIGILALLMLIIGAYQYLMAVGSGKADAAKETISSALLGLILGLCSWIILNKINPDLVAMREITKIEGVATPVTPPGTPPVTPPGTPGIGNGSCDPDQGSCQSSNLSCFGSAASAASQICGYESGGGNPMALSKTDITRDGKSFSVGLFQINLTVHDLGMGCTSAFSGKNYNATVVNQALYEKCVAKAQDPSYSISYACQLYKSRGSFGDWKNTVKKCGL